MLKNSSWILLSNCLLTNKSAWLFWQNTNWNSTDCTPPAQWICDVACYTQRELEACFKIFKNSSWTPYYKHMTTFQLYMPQGIKPFLNWSVSKMRHAAVAPLRMANFYEGSCIIVVYYNVIWGCKTIQILYMWSQTSYLSKKK